ncbi:hypothetical protein [Cryobacterium sp. CG_9.6]|uniref:hypothetical protein n=1 Tax=Cryobacterium sp. CG_9.6 TaxID=2760710 RepID=UPI0024762EFC|nr:hypothetical protein [Cryobacterium sp. CG_9.6]MDH6236680.1 hypothetical protein [Cryobacterium sp. CG_9.6]
MMVLFDDNGSPKPVDILNASLWGAGYGVFLVPFGLVAGALSAEAAFGLAKLVVARSFRRRGQVRVIIAGSSSLTSLLVSLLISCAFGFQIPVFYVFLFIVVLAVTHLLDPWLNKKTQEAEIIKVHDPNEMRRGSV